jgi:hypothetical protein
VSFTSEKSCEERKRKDHVPFGLTTPDVRAPVDANNSPPPTPTSIWYKLFTAAAAIVLMPLIVFVIIMVVIYTWLLSGSLYEPEERSEGKTG